MEWELILLYYVQVRHSNSKSIIVNLLVLSDHDSLDAFLPSCFMCPIGFCSIRFATVWIPQPNRVFYIMWFIMDFSSMPDNCSGKGVYWKTKCNRTREDLPEMGQSDSTCSHTNQSSLHRRTHFFSQKLLQRPGQQHWRSVVLHDGPKHKMGVLRCAELWWVLVG